MTCLLSYAMDNNQQSTIILNSKDLLRAVRWQLPPVVVASLPEGRKKKRKVRSPVGEEVTPECFGSSWPEHRKKRDRDSMSRPGIELACGG